MQQQWIISWSDCDVWWKVPFRWQPAQWLDQEEAPKHFPKPNLHQKIGVMVSVWWSDARLIHYSFLNPGETITSEKYAQQTSERHEKLQRLLLALGNRMEPILLHNNAWPRHIMNMSQVQWIEQSSKFCLICHIHLTSRQLTTTSSSISSTFCRENASTTRRMQKMLSKSSSYLEAQIFFLCYRNKQTFLICKNMLIVMVPILTNKDVFEPSYDDLTFRIWNHNYFCTNRKTILMNLVENGHAAQWGRWGWDELRKQPWHIYIIMCKTVSRKLLCNTGSPTWHSMVT